MNSVRLGFEATWRGLWRWLTVAGALSVIVGIVGLVVEHRAEPGFAADRALVGSTFGILVPLLWFSLVNRAFSAGLKPAMAKHALLGAHRQLALMGSLGGLIAGGALLTLALSVGTLSLRANRPDFTPDLFVTAGISLLAGLAYAAWFTLGASFGRRGPLIALLIDWSLGAMSGILAIPWPRAHIRSLLGGAPVLGLEQLTSSLILIALIVTYLLLIRTRVPA